ncbi:oxidoreductase [Pseudomonas sp. BN417]|uniref:NAD(P)/FAD-dependent oxidoreductase n=1 Tax=unclassified Pseudomonas TaxID=196821 RepID=UPI000856CED4|nr:MULTISPECIES: FAD-dependent oxidoreductase [unclassified Pseudomonas]AOE86720.1 putidaredoxin reductase [Pseudomonas sp. TCU-HL1]MDH4556984.1 oxidoreductase [Pseudomonas sp. BN417]
MNANKNLVIVGAGHAGVEVAFSLRANGWEGNIWLVGDAAVIPHHLPPLSKAYLAGKSTPESLYLRTPDAYAAQNIQLLSGTQVTAINRNRRQVSLSDGQVLDYERLVLATGGRPRLLPVASGAAGKAANFRYLRTLEDAECIRQQLIPGNRLVVIGGGYVGLEVAATAIKANVQVTLLDTTDRVLARVTAPPVSAFYERLHRDAGVDIRTGMQVCGFEMSADQQKVTAVLCEDGTRLAADLIVAGIGLIPNCELASAAGLLVDNGIVVNEQMQTSDPVIMAIGDCARFHSQIYGRWVRIESVPNALEQARKVAAIVCGKPTRNETAPWFWSDQYEVGLKMVGLSEGYDRIIIRGSLEQPDFSVFYLQGDRVLAVDTVNRPVEFNLSKQIITDRLPVEPNLLDDESVPLKEIIATANTELNRA